MSKGVSLHIGLNYVDPNGYDGWDGELEGCINDANDMHAIAKKNGFATRTMLIDEQATVRAVKKAITAAAKLLSSGDVFFLTYSGHGGQVPDKNGPEDEVDRKDETWCLWDRQLVDDELFALWKKFKRGVRICMLSDSCHSGTVARTGLPEGAYRRKRGLSDIKAKRMYQAQKRTYDEIQQKFKGAEKAKLGCSIILISGCMDNQTSADGSGNGLFTQQLKAVYRNGSFRYGYRRLRDQVVQTMPPDQTPNYYVIGAPNPLFEAMKPFTI